MSDPIFTTGFDIKSLLLCVIAFLMLSWWMRRPTNLPPGPWGWPLVGYLPNLIISLRLSGLHPHQLFNNLAKKHGPVFSMNIGGQLFVVLNKYGCIKEGFQNLQLNDRPKNPIRDHMQEMGVGLGQASGEAWRQQRRFTITTLRSFGVGKRSFEESICEESKTMINEIILLEESPFDPHYFFTNATANIICAVVFGNRFEYSDPNFKHLVDNMDQNFKLVGAGALILFHPYGKYFQPSTYNALINNFKKLGEFFTGKVSEHISVHDSDNPTDYIDAYLNEIELSKKSEMESHTNVKNLKSTLAGLFVAGLETTSTTLGWAVMYMMAYPEIQDRVQKEIDSAAGRNRLPKLADKDELHFTMATLLEIQRIASAGPLGVAHACGEDSSLAGCTIPKGSIVIPNLWAVHHDPEVWQDPHKFNPERFLDKDGLVQEREELIPFSIGRRVCIGEHLAKMELFILFTQMLHQFTFKKPENTAPLSFKGVSGLATSTGPFLTQAIKRD